MNARDKHRRRPKMAECPICGALFPRSRYRRFCWAHEEVRVFEFVADMLGSEAPTPTPEHRK